ncbi:ankyrin repeat-containing protein [Acrasis kona]|uniref:Ankyrin repeat-containing protein n=1 Tax=Acrasis kona TaxID=1008807 RepID=A0AAW2YXP4_9EUKA
MKLNGTEVPYDIWFDIIIPYLLPDKLDDDPKLYMSIYSVSKEMKSLVECRILNMLHGDTVIIFSRYTSSSVSWSFRSYINDFGRLLGMVRNVLDLECDGTLATNIFLLAVAAGDAKLVEYLLNKGTVDPSAFNNCAIVLASMQGRAEVVDVLMRDTRVKPSVSEDRPLREACFLGYTEVVKLLTRNPEVKPANGIYYCLRGGNKESEEYLFPLITDPGELSGIARMYC